MAAPSSLPSPAVTGQRVLVATVPSLRLVGLGVVAAIAIASSVAMALTEAVVPVGTASHQAGQTGLARASRVLALFMAWVVRTDLSAAATAEACRCGLD